MKRVVYLTFILITLVFISLTTVVAKNESSKDIPEINGVYDDPDFKNIKVRVFVHNERPQQSSVSSLSCYLSDNNSEAQVGATGWKLNSNWTYNLNPSSVPASVGGSNLNKLAKLGFDSWSAPSNVVFTRGIDTNKSKQAYDGLNIISWGRTSGTALAVTYTRYNSTTGQVVDVDTIMNNKFAWSWTDQSINNKCAISSTYDAQNILTHELGHWMGLGDEYDVNYIENTMYGYGSKTEVKKDTLTNGDISGILSIYQ